MSSPRECRVDAHVKVLDERVVARAKRRGLDALVYAPHFTPLPEIRETARRYSDEDLLVVPARELFAGSWRNRRHVLAVGLTDPVPDFITLEAAMAELRRQDAAVLAPHPAYFTFSLDAAEVRAHADLIDAAEPYNTKHWPPHNRRARRIVAVAGLPGFGSSYAHLRGTVGEAWTAFEREIGSEADLVAAFREEAPRRVMRRSGASHRLRCLLEYSHMLWENSGKKLNRILFEGRPDTHPNAAVYDGRFDDAAVY